MSKKIVFPSENIARLLNEEWKQQTIAFAVVIIDIDMTFSGKRRTSEWQKQDPPRIF